MNDAFGAAHRAHASTEGVAHLLPSAAGLLLQAELDAFATLLDDPAHPFVVVIGGVKVADKIAVIDRFTHLADSILIGGAMAFTFLAADGVDVGASRHEDSDGQAIARQAVADAADARLRAAAAGRRRRRRPLCRRRRVAGRAAAQIPDGWMGLDIGPETAAAYGARLGAARTIFWNGPMGVFELEPFAAGTLAVAQRGGRVRRRVGGRRRRFGGGGQRAPASPTRSRTSPPVAARRWSWSRAGRCPAWPHWRRAHEPYAVRRGQLEDAQDRTEAGRRSSRRWRAQLPEGSTPRCARRSRRWRRP